MKLARRKGDSQDWSGITPFDLSCTGLTKNPQRLLSLLRWNNKYYAYHETASRKDQIQLSFQPFRLLETGWFDAQVQTQIEGLDMVLGHHIKCTLHIETAVNKISKSPSVNNIGQFY